MSQTHRLAGATACSSCAAVSCASDLYLDGCGGSSAGFCTAPQVSCPEGQYVSGIGGTSPGFCASCPAGTFSGSPSGDLFTVPTDSRNTHEKQLCGLASRIFESLATIIFSVAIVTEKRHLLLRSVCKGGHLVRMRRERAVWRGPDHAGLFRRRVGLARPHRRKWQVIEHPST